MGCPQVNCLAGIAPAGADPAQLRQNCVDNLRFAARQLGEHGIRLVIEPIDTRDIPGFYLCGTQQAVDLIRDTESNNIALQNHVCHIQIMEDDLAPTIQRHLADIGHIQLADNPGRHEPGTGEINYPFLFAFIDQIGYRGWIGCEYIPRTTTAEGLGWFDLYELLPAFLVSLCLCLLVGWLRPATAQR